MIVIEDTLVEQVNLPQVEMPRPDNQQQVADNQILQLLIEQLQEEMLLQLPLRQEEEPVEQIQQVLQIEVVRNIVIRNIKIVNEILKRLDILVRLAEILETLFNQTDQQLPDNLTTKDQLLIKVEVTIKDQVVLKVKADNIISLHKLILVQQIQIEAQDPQIDLIQHQIDQIHPVHILHQVGAIAILHQEVVVPEAQVEA